jgi:hypothetical protein
MRVSTRLFVLVASLAALLLVIGGFGVYGARQSNDALRMVYQERTVPAVALGQIDALTFSSRMHVAQALANPLPDVIAFSVKEIAANQKQIAGTWAQYREHPLDGEAEALAADWEKAFKAYDDQGLKPAVTALLENDITTAQAAMVEKMTPLSAPVNRSIQALQQIQIEGARTEFEAAGTRYRALWWGSVGLIGFGLLCAITFGWSTVRSITAQLGCEPAQANEVAQRLSAGDFSADLRTAAAPQPDGATRRDATQPERGGGARAAVVRSGVGGECGNRLRQPRPLQSHRAAGGGHSANGRFHGGAGRYRAGECPTRSACG